MVLITGLALVFLVLLFEFRTFSAPVSNPCICGTFLLPECFLALLITRTDLTDFLVLMGLIMVVGIVSKSWEYPPRWMRM